MCTVTWTRISGGYVLLFNRDERTTRRPALGPRVGERDGVSFIAPVDGDHGGSWIGVNQFGLTLCLLNRYGDAPGVSGRDYTSRGLLLTELLDCGPNQLVERISVLDFDRFRPFTLLALPADSAALSVGWTGREYRLENNAEALVPFTSTSLKEPKIAAERKRQFDELTAGKKEIPIELLFHFHRSHLPERGPYSVCMHREEATTVSLSEVKVTEAAIELTYHPGSPCVAGESQRVRIERAS